MKKVKVTLNQSSTGKKFYLFPSAEALYLWSCSLERGETIEIPGLDELLLEPGQFIEAELVGFEYAYDGKNHKRFDLIRLGKAHIAKNAAGLQVSTHSGWVTGNLLPLRDYSDPHIDVKHIEGNDSRLDLAAFFDDENEDD